MNKHLLLGFDVGSSSVKVSLVDVNSGECVATAFYPEHEAPIKSIRNGWAEQDPEMWWANAKLALARIMAESGAKGDDGEQILPVVYSDNYIALMPGESRDVTVEFADEDRRDSQPHIEVSAFNGKAE